MQVQTAFVEHKPQQMNGQNGPWTLHKFKGTDGRWYEFGKQDAANAAYALFQSQTPVLVTYEEKQNGQYTNYRASAVQAVGDGGAVLAPTVVPAATPQAAAPAAGAPVTAPTTSTTPNYRGESSPNEAGRIARSVGLEQAVNAVVGGVVTVASLDELYDVAGGFAAYIFKGSRPGQAAAAAPPSDGAGGGTQTGPPVTAVTAPVAPASAPPAAEAPQTAPLAPAPTADQDIPF